MSKKLLFVLSFFVFLSLPVVVSAEDATTMEADVMIETNDPVSEKPTTRPLPVKKAITSELKKETMEYSLMATDDTVKDKMTAAREAMKEKMAAAREEFKEKIATIKDQRKQNVASNIDSKIKTMNERHTKIFSERVDRLTNILSKISTKEAALKSEGKTTTTLVAAIEAAQTAIDEARTSVEEQKEKDYVMTITTDSALRTSASTTIKSFLTDIKSVREDVMSAQKAVMKAFTTAAQLSGEQKTTITPTPVE